MNIIKGKYRDTVFHQEGNPTADELEIHGDCYLDHINHKEYNYNDKQYCMHWRSRSNANDPTPPGWVVYEKP